MGAARRLNGELLLFAHVMRGLRTSATCVVMTARLAFVRDSHRLLLAHVVRNLCLRSARVMVAILFGIRTGLRHRGQRDERSCRNGNKDFAGCHICYSIVTRDDGM